jgi:hypothetical protein
VYLSREHFAVVRSDAGALVVWSDSRRTTRGDMLAARVSATGEVLDPHGILVATRSDFPDIVGAPRVAAGAGMDLLWHGLSSGVDARRVSAAGGC